MHFSTELGAPQEEGINVSEACNGEMHHQAKESKTVGKLLIMHNDRTRAFKSANIV